MTGLTTWLLAALLAMPQGGLQKIIDAAPEGSVVDLPRGVWKGPLVIDKNVTLRGGHDTVIDGGGEGTVIVISAPETIVKGLTVRASGKDASGIAPDACIRLTKSATKAIVRDNSLSDCQFGIWVHETDGATISGNRITGDEKLHTSLRGNGIQLFNADNLRVENNRITGGRDAIYVSTTQDSVITGNRLERSRYGIHYMFSLRNHINENVITDSQAGIALMQSWDLEVEGNVVMRSKTQGILLRDIQKSRIANNRLENNRDGLFFYGSTENELASNQMIDNDIGLKIWGQSIRNKVHGNHFTSNKRQVFYVGTDDLEWGAESGNYWSDYVGWDQDGDGIGDRPYRAESFTSRLLFRFPAAALLLRSPSLELLAHMEQRLPILRTPTVIDQNPVVDGEKL